MRLFPGEDMRLVLATRNKGKIAEISQLLKNSGMSVEVLGLDAFPEIGTIPETGISFAENALIKAGTVADRTGMVSLADDSGLEVDALGGAPGVHSARYSGAEASDRANNLKLLSELHGLPPENRTARFRCVLAVCTPNREHLLAQGVWEGSIAEQPVGEHGFGYDPLFLDPQSGLTAAQMDRAAKNERSHRAKALKDFLDKWPGFLERIGSKRPA